MAAAIVDDFSIWLGNKLQALNTDEGVFGSYITGILDGDETLEEKMDALEGILSDFVVCTFRSNYFMQLMFDSCRKMIFRQFVKRL